VVELESRLTCLDDGVKTGERQQCSLEAWIARPAESSACGPGQNGSVRFFRPVDAISKMTPCVPTPTLPTFEEYGSAHTNDENRAIRLAVPARTRCSRNQSLQGSKRCRRSKSFKGALQEAQVSKILTSYRSGCLRKLLIPFYISNIKHMARIMLCPKCLVSTLLTQTNRSRMCLDEWHLRFNFRLTFRRMKMKKFGLAQALVLAGGVLGSVGFLGNR
jgi:hypothetical protein